jgi:ataxia telangiectasia mutated family protein
MEFSRGKLHYFDQKGVLTLQTKAGLKDIIDLCLQSVEGETQTVNSAASHIATQAPHTQYVADDDDFGEIRTADTDAMPQSKEALECQRAAASHLAMLLTFRLRSSMFLSGHDRPSRDAQVINALILADGPRFIQLGMAICDAVRDGLLRLTTEAIDHILTALSEMLSSYAYARDEAMLNLTIAFIQCAAPVWLNVDQANDDIADQALGLAKFLIAKINRGQVPAWRVRLNLLVFLDEYLEHDPHYTLWSQTEEDEDMDKGDASWGPMSHIMDAVFDPDARVRYRVATSAAILFYLPSVPANRHRSLYGAVMERLVGHKDTWDYFLTDLVWKLNGCIASTQIRAGTIYHLYEMQDTSDMVDLHLQMGLDAVAHRLGLASPSILYLAYAVVIVRSQVNNGQRILSIPHRLYGFPTRQKFAAACLSAIGSWALTIQSEGIFKSLCEAAGYSVAEAVPKYYAGTAAMCYVDAVGGGDGTTAQQHALALEMLNNVWDVDNTTAINAHIESIISRGFDLVDLATSSEDVIVLLDQLDTTKVISKAFTALTSGDEISTEAAPAIEATTTIVVHVHSLLQTAYPKAQASRIVFDAMLRIFTTVNETFLVSEQRRALRGISLVAALYHNEFQNPVILEVFIQTLLSLLDKPDITVIAFSMLRWGVSRIPSVTTPLPHLVDLLIRLGTTRTHLSSLRGVCRSVGDDMESWISQEAPNWQKVDSMRDAVEISASLWDSQLSRHLHGWPEPLYTDVASLAAQEKVHTPMMLCKRLAQTLDAGGTDENVTTFLQSTFWHLKKVLTPDDWQEEGAMAFLDLLYAADGRIHAPSLDTISGLSNDNRHRDTQVRLKDYPTMFLRAVIIQVIVELAASGDYVVRKTAYDVLKAMLPCIGDLAEKTVLPATTVMHLSLLIPSAPSGSGVERVTLDCLVSDETWVRRSGSPSDWARGLATLLSQSLAADEAFYSHLGPILSSTGSNVIEFLPYLVQASLTHGVDPKKTSGPERSKQLSAYFTMILQSSVADTKTVEIIIKIILHLRHFVPPWRTTTLGHNAWLDIRPILLSQSAIKCDAYATALLFLEQAKEILPKGHDLDMLAPEVQSVSRQGFI